MGFGQAVEVDEEVVPGFLLLVAVLGGFESEEGDAPCEGGDEIFVGADDVKGAANRATGVEVCEDGGCVVCGLFVVEDGARGFEELGRLVRYSGGWQDGTGDLRSGRLVGSTCSCHPPRWW
jgi:hypothetical protein